MTDKGKEVAHIEKLRDSAKNRILNFPLNVVEYNRADGKHGFLRDSAILAQTEALLAISEELALIRENLQNRQQKQLPTSPRRRLRRRQDRQTARPGHHPDRTGHCNGLHGVSHTCLEAHHLLHGVSAQPPSRPCYVCWSGVGEGRADVVERDAVVGRFVLHVPRLAPAT